MLKRIISLFIAFVAGIYWSDKVTHTETWKNNVSIMERTEKISCKDFVATVKIGTSAGEEIANKLWSKHS